MLWGREALRERRRKAGVGKKEEMMKRKKKEEKNEEGYNDHFILFIDQKELFFY